MREDRAELLRTLIKRILITSPLFIIGTLLLREITLFSIFGLFLFLFGALLVAKPAINLVFNPFGSVIFPFSSGNKVALNFSIPEARIMDGDFKKALALYQEMIPKDPKRVEIYTRIINLSAIKMQQPETALSTFQLGLKNITDMQNREKLSIKYQRAMATLRNQVKQEANSSSL